MKKCSDKWEQWSAIYIVTHQLNYTYTKNTFVSFEIELEKKNLQTYCISEKMFSYSNRLHNYASP